MGQFLKIKTSFIETKALSEKKSKFFLWLFTYSFSIGLLTFLIHGINVPWVDFLLKGKLKTFFYFFFRLSSHQIFLALINSFPFFFLGTLVLLLLKKKKEKRILSIFTLLTILATSLQTLFLLFSITDFYVFRLYKIRLEAQTLSILSFVDLTSIVQFLKNSSDIILVTAIYLLGFLLSIVFARWIWSSKFKLGIKTGFCFLVIYIVFLVMSMQIKFYTYQSEFSNERYLQSFFFKRHMIKAWKKVTADQSKSEVLALKVNKMPISSDSLKYPKNPMNCHRGSHFPLLNIFFIVLDSIRFDMLNQEVMPNTFALSQKGINFSHHYSTGNNSIFGLFGLFYGISPFYIQLISDSKKRSVFVNEMLSNEYFIDLYTYWSFKSTNLDRTAFVGLKKNENQFHVFDFDLSPTWKSDEATVKAILDDLSKKSNLNEKSKEKPHFGLFFLGSPHDFSSPFPEKSKFQPITSDLKRLTLSRYTPIEPVLNLYKSSVFFVDQLVGKILKALEKGGWMKNSIVIITSDHGQEVNKMNRGHWEHISNFSDWQIRVPFVLYWPGRKKQTLNHITSHVDIVPTLMQDLFNCKNPTQDYSFGKNLFNNNNQKRHLFVFRWFEEAILTGDEVYAFEFRNKKNIRVFDALTYERKEKPVEKLLFLKELIKKHKKHFSSF